MDVNGNVGADDYYIKNKGKFVSQISVTLTNCSWTGRQNPGGGIGVSFVECPGNMIMTKWDTADDDVHPTRAYCCDFVIQ